MEMFDQIVETKIEADGTTQVRTMHDESDAMDEACREFVAAEKRFRKLDAHPDVVCNPRLNVQWWSLLEEMYLCDKKVWRLFIGSQPTMADNMLYARFREKLLGKGFRADA